LEPDIIPADAAVSNTAVPAGEPGDGPFDHGPVGAVIILEGRVNGALTVFALQRIVLVKFDFASLR
jgi:hypothetical protein